MKRYQVVDPKGVLHNGETVAKGQHLPPGVTGSQVAAWRRFGQIKEVVEKPAKTEDPKPPADGGKTIENKPPADPK